MCLTHYCRVRGKAVVLVGIAECSQWEAVRNNDLQIKLESNFFVYYRDTLRLLNLFLGLVYMSHHLPADLLLRRSLVIQ